MHVSPHHPALSSLVTPLPPSVKRNSDAQDARAVAQAKVKGLYAFTQKKSGKDSDSTGEESGTTDSSLSSNDADSPAATTEGDGVPKPAPAGSGFLSAALTYTAKGVMSAVPKTPGEVFQTIV